MISGDDIKDFEDRNGDDEERLREWEDWITADVPESVDESTLPRCIECGGKVCCCGEEDDWNAHCIDCDNNIYNFLDPDPETGKYTPFATTQREAADRWIEQNTPK